MKHDPVNHPSHYTSHPSGIECIEVTRHMSFNIGNAIKYLWRNGLKEAEPSIKDLRKAIWYINDQIKMVLGSAEREPLNEHESSYQDSIGGLSIRASIEDALSAIQQGNLSVATLNLSSLLREIYRVGGDALVDKRDRINELR